jgi:hypothetical protein
MAVDLIELARQNAEEGRNYNAAFQGTGQYGTPGTSGGEGGAGYSYDPNAPLPAVGWDGPAAYNMSPAGTAFLPGTEAEMYAALARAKQFDPNASLMPQMGTTGEGGSIDQQQFVLNYDQSKVPQPVHPNLAPVGNYGSNESVWNENMLYNDPNYGVMTDPRNLRGSGGWDWLGTVGPLAVSAFGFGIPALAAGMSAGALGGAFGSAAGMPWYGSAGLETAKELGGGHFNPVALAGAYAPGVAGAFAPAAAGADNWSAAAMGDPTAYGLPSGDNWDPSVMGNPAAYGMPTNTEVNWGKVGQGVQSGAKAYGAYQAIPKKSTQTEVTSGYNPQNFGKLNQPLVPSGDTQSAASSYADMPYTFGNRGY